MRSPSRPGRHAVRPAILLLAKTLLLALLLAGPAPALGDLIRATGSGAGAPPTKATRDIQKNLHSEIYQETLLDPCVRLLSAEGTFGCHAPSNRNGVLYEANSVADVDLLLQDQDLERAGPFVPILPVSLFSDLAIFERLVSSPRVAGILVRGDCADTPNAPLCKGARSTAPACPNCQFGLYHAHPELSTYPWNKNGTGLNFRSSPVPIASLRPHGTDEDEDSLRAILHGARSNAGLNFKGDRLHAIEMRSFMHATGSSGQCLRRKQCDPLGGHSAWAASRPLGPGASKPQSFVLISAALDTNAFFQDQAFGVGSDITAALGVLGAAHAFGEYVRSAGIDTKTFEKDVLFALFDAEAFALAGSSRFAQEIVNFKCDKYPKGTDTTTAEWCESPYRQSLAFRKLSINSLAAHLHLTQLGTASPFPGDPAAGDPADQLPALAQLFAHVHNADIGSDAVKLVELLRKLAVLLPGPADSSSPSASSSLSSSSSSFSEADSSLSTGSVSTSGSGSGSGSAPASASASSSAPAGPGDLPLAVVPAWVPVQRHQPPASTHPFLMYQDTIASVVLSDFHEHYQQTNYHSQLDTAASLANKNAVLRMICDTSTLIARAAFSLATGAADPAAVPAAIQANCTMVNELFDCMTTNISCPLLAKYFTVASDNTRLNYYAGVYRPGFVSVQSRMAHDLLADFMAVKKYGACQTHGDCASTQRCVGQTCMEITSAYHAAYGTGLAESGPGGTFEVLPRDRLPQGVGGTYTESHWDYTSGQVFLKSRTSAREVGELFGGIAIGALSVVLLGLAFNLLSRKLKTE